MVSLLAEWVFRTQLEDSAADLLCLHQTSGNRALFNAGNNLMLAGIIIQVAQLVLLASVTAEYAIRTWIHRHELAEEKGPVMTAQESRRFRWFAISCIIAYIGILARCCNR